MTQPPYNEARRVFWIVDNGSSHRGHACAERLRAKYPRLVLVNGPIHASWLNQVEIYSSIVQRKALTPNDFSSLEALEQRLIGFQHYYERIAKPFQWKFTRDDLTRLLEKIPLAARGTSMKDFRYRIYEPEYLVTGAIDSLMKLSAMPFGSTTDSA